MIFFTSLLLVYFSYYCEGYSDEEELIREVSKNSSLSRVKATTAATGELSYFTIFYEKRLTYIKGESYRMPICSGNILNARWVLTTATPLAYYPIDTLSFYAGTKRQYSEESDTLPESLYNVSLVKICLEWDENSENNVALVRTSSRIAFGMEIGTIRIPLHFNSANANEIICKMGIWSSMGPQHLMGSLQSTVIEKQYIHLKLTNNSELCPKNINVNKTFCLLHFNDSKVDVCAVNIGSAITLEFGMVALFTGKKIDFKGCVDQPLPSYTAVNLYNYVKWISGIVNEPIFVKNYTTRIISFANHRSLSFTLLFLPLVSFLIF